MTTCAYCDRPAAYGVISLGTEADLPGNDWFDLLPDAGAGLMILGLAYCRRHTGQALAWANSTTGALNGAEPIIGPADELVDVLELASESDDDLSGWVLTFSE